MGACTICYLRVQKACSHSRDRWKDSDFISKRSSGSVMVV
jgi:hypothetical protein